MNPKNYLLCCSCSKVIKNKVAETLVFMQKRYEFCEPCYLRIDNLQRALGKYPGSTGSTLSNRKKWNKELNVIFKNTGRREVLIMCKPLDMELKVELKVNE